MNREPLTATRMAKLLTCPRAHFWRYEIGLRIETASEAMRFGTVWHLAMELRWRKVLAQDAFEKATASKEIDETAIATMSALFAGYYAHYENDPVKEVHPEVEFRYPLIGSRSFDVAGKIDGLAVMHDGRLALVEHKTAGCDIAPDSDYWLRLRSNPQIMQYILAARQLGWDVSLVIYDVTRKPSIRVKQNETLEQFSERLAADTKERPDFYFARREVPILEDDLQEFQAQRLTIARMILSCRAEAKKAKRPEHAWPRNLGEMTCRNCEYAGFCLQNCAVDREHPPAGFIVGEINPELQGVKA